VTPDERIRWFYFAEEIDETLQAQTLDEAFSGLTGLRHSVYYLPYKDDRHEFDANVCLDAAENHIIACETDGRTHPKYWRDELAKELSEIPKYAGRPDETPPPPILDPQ
jgi:hypothetical protein